MSRTPPRDESQENLNRLQELMQNGSLGNNTPVPDPTPDSTVSPRPTQNTQPGNLAPINPMPQNGPGVVVPGAQPTGGALYTAPAVLPAGAQAEFNRVRGHMLRVLERQEDQAVRANYTRYYNVMLGQYSAYAARTYAAVEQAEQRHIATTGSPMPPHTRESLARAHNFQFWQQFNTTTIPGLERELSQATGVHYNTNNVSPVRQAFVDLGNEMRGPSIFQSVGRMFYDPERARATGSTMGGINFGGILGAVAGFFAGGVFGQTGLMGMLIRGAMAIGFAYGGSKLQEYAMGSGNQPANSPLPPQTAQNQAQGNTPGLGFGSPQPGANPQQPGQPAPTTTVAQGTPAPMDAAPLLQPPHTYQPVIGAPNSAIGSIGGFDSSMGLAGSPFLQQTEQNFGNQRVHPGGFGNFGGFGAMPSPGRTPSSGFSGGFGSMPNPARLPGNYRQFGYGNLAPGFNSGFGPQPHPALLRGNYPSYGNGYLNPGFGANSYRQPGYFNLNQNAYPGQPFLAQGVQVNPMFTDTNSLSGVNPANQASMGYNPVNVDPNSPFNSGVQMASNPGNLPNQPYR